MFAKYSPIILFMCLCACGTSNTKIQNEEGLKQPGQEIVASPGGFKSTKNDTYSSDTGQTSDRGEASQQEDAKKLELIDGEEKEKFEECEVVSEEEDPALLEQEGWRDENAVTVEVGTYEENIRAEIGDYEENICSKEDAGWQDETDLHIAEVYAQIFAAEESEPNEEEFAEEVICSITKEDEEEGAGECTSVIDEKFSVENTIEVSSPHRPLSEDELKRSLNNSMCEASACSLSEETSHAKAGDNKQPASNSSQAVNLSYQIADNNGQATGLINWWKTMMAIAIDETPDAWQGQLHTSEFWRSSLYPKGWEPGYKVYSKEQQKELFLQDYSYAGYHQGSKTIPTPHASDIIFNVVNFGADISGFSDSWAAVQKAILAAEQATRGVVYFPAGNYLIQGSLSALDDLKDELNIQPNPPSAARLNALDFGRLRIADSHVILRGAGQTQTKLYFPRSEGMSKSAHILFKPLGSWGHSSSSAQYLLHDANVFDTSVIVGSLGSLAVGNDIVLGMKINADFLADFNVSLGQWPIDGVWIPFFHRKITAIETVGRGFRIHFDVPLRHVLKIRDNVSVKSQNSLLKEVGIQSLAISNAVEMNKAWKVDPSAPMHSGVNPGDYSNLMTKVHLLEMEGVKNSFIHKVKSFGPSAFNLPYQSGKHIQSGGILLAASKNVTVAEVTMQNAQNRGPKGNGYLFKVQRSNEILVRDSVGQNGRHNFIVSHYFGTNGCVFLRIYSSGSKKYYWNGNIPYTTPAHAAKSDFHKALSVANLIDSSSLHDGWLAKYYGWGASNRHAAQTSYQNVFWNNGGSGTVVSHQFRYGYNIGARGSMRTDIVGQSQTSPRDFLEGGYNLMVGQTHARNIGDKLFPSSLYEHQLVRRKGGYPGTQPSVQAPQSVGCPWGMNQDGFHRDGTPICKSVAATAIKMCHCVKQDTSHGDAFIYGSQCLFDEGGHYRARELKSGNCNACPWWMTKIGEYQGKNVCKPTLSNITTQVSEVTCLDTNGELAPSGYANKCLWYRSYNSYNGYYKARDLNGLICPMLQVHLGNRNGKPVCHTPWSLPISQITCVDNGDDIWSTSSNDWCVHEESSNGSVNWYKARVSNHICPSYRPYIGTHPTNGKPVCQRLPNIEISQVTCANNGDVVWDNGNSDWCINGTVYSGGSISWYKARSANNVCPNLRPHLGNHPTDGKPICQALPNIAMSYAACFSNNNSTWVSSGGSDWCLMPRTGWHKARSLGAKCPGAFGLSLMTYKGMKNGKPVCKYNPSFPLRHSYCYSHGGSNAYGGCALPRSGWYKWRQWVWWE
jgi:hypothetical protein